MHVYSAVVHDRNMPQKVTSIFAFSYQDALYRLSLLYDYYEDVMEIENE